MSFLAPLFMLGGLAVALPVIFHLIRRTTRERKVFSSLMFLMPSPPRLTRRSRLEHLLLLALRCLVLCLLALGFSRPFFKRAMTDDRPAANSRRVVVLVDTSASMRRANLWPDARDRVETVLRRTSPADQVAVLAFDRDVRPLVTFEQWNAAAAGDRVALAAARLAETSPGWSSTHLGHALISAAEILVDTPDKAATGPRQLVLISDLQEGSRLDQLQGYEWPKGVELTVESLKAVHANNAAVQLVTDSNETASPAGGGVRVRVNNAADSKREQFKVGWWRSDGSGFAGAPLDVYVPPGQSRILPVPPPPAGVAADRIVLQGDEETFDNTVFAVPPETARSSVLYFGSESERDPRQPLYFLRRAFQDTQRQSVQVLPRPPGADAPAAGLQDAALLVVADSLPDALAAAVHDQAAAGKTVLFALKTNAAAATLARVCGVNGLTIEEVRPANYAMLAEIDFRHPLFAAFADPRFSDFTRIHFWKYRRLNAAAIPGARVIAGFDSGDPAVLEVPVGKGRVLILTSGWQPDDSQLALSTKFVPLLYAALDYSGAALPAALQYFVGDAVPIVPAAGAAPAPATIRAPDGSEIRLAAGETNFSRTTQPGVYTFVAARSTGQFAVNLDAAEGRTAPLPPDELERLGAPLARSAAVVAAQAAHQVRLQSAELENRQKLWRWFIVAALAMLLFETWLAGRTARRVTAPEGMTP